MLAFLSVFVFLGETMSNLIIRVVDYFQEKAHIHSIRRTVFQQEQRITPDVDFDGLDETATQIVAYLEGVAVGTARVRYLNHQTAKIERLAVLPIFRGRGIGLKIMETALSVATQNQAGIAVIHAQHSAKAFHQKLGFSEEEDSFIEGGILHIKMRKILNVDDVKNS
jgi:predicted GNAT family N-acyltransferase